MNTRIIKISTIVLMMIGNQITAGTSRNDVVLENDSIAYLEEDDYTELDFSTEAYLPEGFNPYMEPSNFKHVSYIEEAKETDLGFVTKAYLPEGFSPYKFFFDIHSIEYIEENDELELDFKTSPYLPANSDTSFGK
jgi:hypothetical protein